MLHLAAGNLFGGVERVLVTLAKLRHLAPDVEPEFGLSFRGRLGDELAATGVAVHDLGAAQFRRPWTVVAARRRLRTLLDTRRYEVVVAHACWPHAVFAPTVRAARVRLVTFAHDALAGRHWLERWAARTPPNRVLANSRDTLGSVPRVFANVPAAVAYLPVEAAAPRDPDDVAKLRRELETPSGDVVVLHASRLERWKGAAVLVEALGRLADVPGWTLWLAGGVQKPGEAAYLAELRQAARRPGVAGCVRFLSQRDDVPRLMQAADLFCQPNTAPEPFGVALVEALAAGLPVVTTGLGGAAEVVTRACAVLVEPGNPTALADVLRTLIASPSERQRLGAAGPARACELCDPAVTIPQFYRLLTDPEPKS